MKDLAMAVVFRAGKILLQERFRHKKGMVFEFPGGSVELGESGVNAATRELLEETGLKDLVCTGSHLAKNEYGGKIHFVLLSASMNQEPIALSPSRQQTFHWFKSGEIPKKDLFKADIQFKSQYLVCHPLQFKGNWG